jgi:hypothetical protein
MIAVSDYHAFKVKINPIYFDKTVIRPEAIHKLANIVMAINDNPYMATDV